MKFNDVLLKRVEMFSKPEFIERVTDEDKTMLKHLDILKEINIHGFITNESQAGNHRKFKKPNENTQYEIIERAYISGFMLESIASKFITSLSIETDKIAFFIPCVNDDVYLPSQLDIPLTIIVKDGKYSETHTHMSSAFPKSHWESERKQLNLNKSEKIVFIECIDYKWKRNASSPHGLFTDVLNTLKKLQ